MTTQQQNWFTHAEAAAYCRISPRTLRRWRNATPPRVRAYGGRYFRDDLDRAVRNEDPELELEPRDVVRDSPLTETGQTVTMHRVTGENFLSGWPGLGAKQAMASELEIQEAQTSLVAAGLDSVAASVLIQNAIELSRVSLFTFRGALEHLRSTAEERQRRVKIQQRFGVGFSEPQQHTGTNYITQVMNAIPLCICTVDEITAIVENPKCPVHGQPAGALQRSPENPCPTCGAVYRSVRRHPMPSGQLMTGIGCTDPWHPRAPETDVVPLPEA